MRQRPAIALGVLLLAGLILAGSAEKPLPEGFFGRYIWHRDMAEFGGFSGLDLGMNGRDFVAVTDRGFLARGILMREGGQIIGVRLDHFAPITAAQGKTKWTIDAESIELGPDGLYISYEQDHHVLHRGDSGRVSRLPGHPDFQLFPPNGGIEALALDAMGRLHAIPERFLRNKGVPIYRFDGSHWSVVATLQRVGGFVPVGASFGPDGALYILERAFSGFAFRSRVRRVIETDDGWSDHEIFRSPLGAHDNLEGLATWRDEAGHIRLTMISDDNFLFLQRTEFVEYKIRQDLAFGIRTP